MTACRLRAKECPLLWPLFAFVGGLLLSELLPRLPWWVVIAGLLGMGLLLWQLSRVSARAVLLCVCAAWALIAIGRAYLGRSAPDEALASAETKSYRAHLLASPARKRHGVGYLLQLQADLRYLQAGGLAPTAEKVRLNYYVPHCSLQIGDEIWIQGAPHRLFPSNNNYVASLARKGIFFEDHATSTKVIPTGQTKGNWLWIKAQKLQQLLRKNLRQHLSPESAALAEGLMLGERSAIGDALQNAFAATGSMHILAVSGLHVGILYAVLIFVAAFVPLGRYSLGWRLCLAVVALWGFAFVVGLSASVVRATTLCTLVAASQWLGRRTNPFNSLSAAALLILLFDPEALFSLSFQLSFLAVLGILLLYGRLYALWQPKAQALRIAWGVISVSASAQLAVLPLVVYHFQLVSLVFPLTNLLLMPLLFVVLPLSIGLAGLPWLGATLSKLLEPLLQTMIWLIEKLAAIPGSHLHPIYWNEAQMWVLYGALLAGLCFLLLRQPVYLLMAACLLLVHGGIDWQRSRNSHRLDQLRLSINRKNELLLQYLHKGTAYQSKAALQQGSETRFLQQSGYLHALGNHPIASQPLLPVVDGILYATQIGKQRLLWLKGRAHQLLGTHRLQADILLLSRQSVKDVPALCSRFRFRLAVLAYNDSRVVAALRACSGQRLHLLSEAGPYHEILTTHSQK